MGLLKRLRLAVSAGALCFTTQANANLPENPVQYDSIDSVVKTEFKKKKRDRSREVRCLRCLGRFEVPAGCDRTECPACKAEWRISWHHNGMAKIRGPVWAKFKD